MKRILILSVVLFTVAGTAIALDFDITGQIGIGYSVVDIPKSIDWNENYLEEWSEINYRFNAQGTWGLGDFRAGAELGYSWLYYYEVKVPPTPTYYSGYVGAFNISAVAEYRFERLAVQAGAGAYIFDDGTAFGVHASGTWRFKLKNPDMAIPLTIRADVIFGRATIIPINILTGFSYRIRKNEQ